MAQASWAAKFFIQILKNARHGTIHITFPDGKSEKYGEGEYVTHVTVNKWAAIDLLVNKGDLGLAEAIIEGDLEVDDAAKLVEWACRNDQSLGRALHGTLLGTLLYQLKRLLTRNSKVQAKKNIVAHYDLGNDFYRLWLDPTMSYSSALFKSENESLEQAQLNKYDRMIDMLNIKPSDHILEIGCGWGGFFSRAIERTGCRVTAVMNSPSQAVHNRAMIKAKGLSSHVSLQEIDYRDIRGTYDKIVSIEMIEAVGEKYWDNYFKKVSSSIKGKGSAIIQGITIKDDLFYSYRQKTDFIQNYIFPGGMLLANSIFDRKSEENGMKLTNQFEFGISYADTLKIWRRRFNEAQTKVREMGFDDRFMRMWNLYLCYCEGAFRAGRINVGQYLIERV
ncbi:MAG: cyclopropane-fatty-acyl-phospholipid synthase family protein [Pseudobdellovibrio sp.]|nr:cyclopropane-fatty-acyl-phospholipid synthase family protein [Pseudobdellovibrio sp.]